MDQARSDVAHLYRRAGFGAAPTELDAAARAGYRATVEVLLAGLGSAPDPAGDAPGGPVLPARITAPPGSALAQPAAAASPGTPAAVAANRARAVEEAAELAALQHWWLSRMIATSTPLREKLTLVWHGHFATAAAKVRDARLMYLQNQLFRSRGAASFEDLTQAVAKGGAMMSWLDTGTDKATHPNENFARELMELFTLGVGPYTEADVEAAARSFTGWVYRRATDQWALQRGQHDNGVKTFLGHTGAFGGEDIIDIVVHRPESARFVVSRVWSHLAYPVAPTDPVVADLVPAFVRAFSVTDLLRALFLHPAFRSATARTGLVKQPIEFLVGAARALHLDAALTPAPPAAGGAAAPGATRTVVSLAALATALGQTPFNPPNVGGWPQNGYWLNTGTSLVRLQVAGLMAGRADLSAVSALDPPRRPAAVARLLGLGQWGPTTTAALGLVAADPVSLVALALNAPEYVLN